VYGDLPPEARKQQARKIPTPRLALIVTIT
jgi:hypothetical protein